MKFRIAWLYIIFGFMPIVCMFALMHVNNRATTEALEQKGMKVSWFFGAKRAEMRRLLNV